MLSGGRGRALLLAASAAVLVALVSERALSSRPSTPRSADSVVTAPPVPDEERPAAVEPAQPPPAPTLAASAPAATSVARADAGAPRTTDTLIASLDSKDDFVVLEAAGDLAKRGATRALPALVAIDIKGRPHAAPSVIDALGRLGGASEPAARRSATDRLLELLTQERGRGAPESAGNVLAIYEALGRTLDPRGAPALEAELLDPNVTWAAKTVIVEALARLKQASSKGPLRSAQEDIADHPATDPLEAETQRELSGAVAGALRVIP